MSSIPISSAMVAGQALGFADPFSGSKGWQERFGDQPVSQFHAAQMIAERWQCSRADMEGYALESHRRALQAVAEGRFKREIVPCAGLEHDETPRNTSLARMAELEALGEGSWLTAGVASQTCDAAAALLVVSEEALKRYNLTPRARIHHLSVLGDDPVWMLTAPIAASQKALRRCGMSWSDIDLAEVNEAFASVAQAWLKETGFPHERTNVNGGAIALGHPLGATGARLAVTLLHELERTQGRFGLQTMCEGGGLANVTIIERI